MKRKLIKQSLYDSEAYTFIDYAEYKQICDDYEWECHEENSPAYWEDINRLTDDDWDCFIDNLRYSKYNNSKYMILGSVGRWNGRYDIVPVLVDNLETAIMKCLNMNGDIHYEIKLEEGKITVVVAHHDGTDSFEIRLLSKKGEREINRPCYWWNGKDYEPKKDWFKNIYGYLF